MTGPQSRGLRLRVVGEDHFPADFPVFPGTADAWLAPFAPEHLDLTAELIAMHRRLTGAHPSAKR